jgi:dual specificity protein kinase YAK1
VYSAIFTNPDSGAPREYAVKVADSADQFDYEAQALAFIRPRSFISSFVSGGHHCLLFELLGPSILDALERGSFRGFALNRIQAILRELLLSLAALHDLGLVHCDVKPENILFLGEFSANIELIDFGSCCISGDSSIQYVQSRYYRAPEVALGAQFDAAADIWSAGCVAAEMMLGLPLFPAKSQRHLLFLMDDMLGPFPSEMVKQSPEFGPDGSVTNHAEFGDIDSYFLFRRLDDIIMAMPVEGDRARDGKIVFLDLLHAMLALDPKRRVGAWEAARHSFFQLELGDGNRSDSD